MELAGAVLTSYVGINGLVQRLAIDRVLPRVLLQKNAWRLTNHYIILAYFVVASSLVLVLNGQVSELSGVFSLAFLGVITSFIIGCLLLKIEREEMPCAIRSSWTNLFFCLVMIVLGIIANALSNLTPLGYFAIYFAVIGFVVLIMLERVRLLKAVLYVSKQVLLYFKYTRRGQTPPALPQNLLASSSNVGRNHGVIGSVFIAKTIERIKKTPVIFFCKRPNLPKINEAVSYVIHNEQTYCLRLVHTCAKNDEIPREFEDIVSLFDHIYPSIKIDFVFVTGNFEPALIEWISMTMVIPTNMMFMRQPSNEAMHQISASGVRIITN